MKRRVLLFLVFSGCASTVLKAEDFEQVCAAQGECHPVYFGELCDNKCHCFNGAVNEQGNAKWETEKASIQCSSNLSPPPCQCEAPLTGCVDGKCTLL